MKEGQESKGRKEGRKEGIKERKKEGRGAGGNGRKHVDGRM